MAAEGSSSSSSRPPVAEDSPLILIRDPVPTYDSVPAPIIAEKASMLGKVRHVKAASTGNVEYVARALPEILYCGDICVGVILAIVGVVYMSFVIVGALFIDDCPRESYIPLYLVVAGVSGIVMVAINTAEQIHKQCTEEDDGMLVRMLKTGLRILQGDDDEDDKYRALKIVHVVVESVLAAFMLAWFIAGSVWVFSVLGDYTQDKTSDDYCDEVVYMFAFVTLLVQYGLLALVLSWGCGLLLLGCCIASKIHS